MFGSGGTDWCGLVPDRVRELDARAGPLISKFCLFHFLYFGSVGIIHFATASVVRVVMNFFINQGASKLFIDFCFVLLKSGTRGGFVFKRAGLLLPRWSHSS